jgi:hypothetical protein
MKKELILNPTIGADVEVFLKNKQGEVVTAEGIIRGTKYDPFQFLEDQPFFATSLDNVMAEFSIPPVKTREDFAKNIQTSMDYISSILPQDLSIFAFPAAELDEKFLQTENSLTFGCDPDFNAWNHGLMNQPPNPYALGTLRTCGGHVHVGYDNPDVLVSMSLIKAMDLFIGLPMLLAEPNNQRKNVYGKAGAFRPKAYGVEYRTVSNYYINNKDGMQWIFDATNRAIDFINGGNDFSENEGASIVEGINTGNLPKAREILKYFGVPHYLQKAA